MTQQLVNLGFNGIFAIILARFVSVGDFGLFNYAITLASLGMAVMVAGLSGLAVREFANRPESAEKITAAIIFIREFMAVIAYGLLIGISAIGSEERVLVASAVACLAIFARVFDAPELWFQANLRAKEPAVIRTIIATIFFAIRLIVLMVFPSIVLLLVLFACEQLVSSLTIYVRYAITSHKPSIVRPSASEVKFLWKSALPLIISSAASQINLRIDVVILQALKGSYAVGIYSAAARLSELMYVFPVAYMNATFPRLLAVRERHGRESVEYRRELQNAFNGAFWFGALVIILTYLLGSWVVVLLFGNAYVDAVQILQIHVLACPFVFMAAVFSKWIIAENKLWLSLGRHGAGAVVSVGLSFALVPNLGGIGAALATVVSYSMASYFFCFLTRSTWGIARMMSFAPIAPAFFIGAWVKSRKGIR
jgi:O-antigen/teichoic acid export membrane protein